MTPCRPGNRRVGWPASRHLHCCSRSLLAQACWTGRRGDLHLSRSCWHGPVPTPSIRRSADKRAGRGSLHTAPGLARDQSSQVGAPAPIRDCLPALGREDPVARVSQCPRRRRCPDSRSRRTPRASVPGFRALAARAGAIDRRRERTLQNLGPITREINIPTTALHFVHPQHRPNCHFDKEGEEEFGGERTWVVRFKERDRGGLISRTDGRPPAGRGAALDRAGDRPRGAERARGEELRARRRRLESGGASEMAAETRRRSLVPAEMRENYQDRG